MSKELLIGIDIGGTKVSGALVSYSGKIYAQEKFATPTKAGPKEVLAIIHKILKDLYLIEKHSVDIHQLAECKNESHSKNLKKGGFSPVQSAK